MFSCITGSTHRNNGNSWWYLIRTEYSLFELRKSNKLVQALYKKYAVGDLPYPNLQQQFNKLEYEIFAQREGESLLNKVFEESNIRAAEDVQLFLSKFGIVVKMNDIPVCHQL